MINIRKSDERGLTQLDWLKSFHTFSFGDYFDPDHIQCRDLRVINDDTIKAGAGFGEHSHRDMEIITYILNGALEHKDSIGNTSVIQNGEVQVMTAGSGITHSEYNHSKTQTAHFYQIWIMPDERELEPGYQQKDFQLSQKINQLILLASSDGKEGSLRVHQDVNLYGALLTEGGGVDLSSDVKRYAWVQVAKGNVSVNENKLNEGDGIAVSEESQLVIKAQESSEILLFDLA